MRVLAIAFLCIFVILPGSVRPGPPDLPTRLRDEFTRDSRREYQLTGEVSWEAGRLTLGPDARLVRDLSMSHHAEVRVAFHLPADGTATLTVRLEGKGTFAETSLTVGQRITLANRTGAGESVLLPPLEKPAGAWFLRVQLQHGVARVRAWPQAATEPKQWQTIRYSGAPHWEPVRLAVSASGSATALSLLEVTGPPATPLAAERRQQAERAMALYAKLPPLYQKASYAEAARLAEEILDLRVQATGADDPLALVFRNDLGVILLAMSRFDEARRHFQETLERRRRVLGPDHPDTAQSLNNLGGLHKEQGDYAGALGHYQQALPVFEKTMGPDAPRTANARHNLAFQLQELGAYAEARRHYESALASLRRSTGEHSLATATTRIALASLLQLQGDLAAARPLHEQALAIRKKTLGEKHPHVAASLGLLGQLLLELGDSDAALELMRQALAIDRAVWGDEHHETASGLLGLGQALLALERSREALPLVEKAVELRARGLGRDHPLSVSAATTYGILLRELGRLGEALPYYERALAYSVENRGPDHPHTALALNNLAVLQGQLGKVAEARTAHEKSLAIYQRQFGKQSPDVASSRKNLGLLLAKQGDRAGAWKELQLASDAYAAFVPRLLISSSEREHMAIVRQWRGVVNLLLCLAEDAPGPERAQLAAVLYRAVLDWRAAGGRTLAARLEALTVGTDEEALGLYRRLQQARQRLVRALMDGPQQVKADTFPRRLEELRREHDDLERALGGRVADFALLRHALTSGVDQLAERLEPGTVLIDVIKYHRYDFKAREGQKEWGQGHYAALLLWRGGKPARTEVRVVFLGQAGPLERAIHVWQGHVQAGKADAKSAAALRHQLWGPLASELPAGTRNLLVAPDGEVALVPLEAIQLADGKYLVEKLTVRYLATGRDLLPRPAVRAKSDVALVVADPDYDAGGLGKAPAGGVRFRSLPGFAREAAAVTGFLNDKRGWKVQALRGAEASEEALLQAARPRLLYLISHGFFLKDDEGRPVAYRPVRDLELTGATGPTFTVGADPRLRSGLALAGANRRQERSARGLSDGLLTALEVENLNLWGTELVILSACETGLGEFQVGEGVLGLRRAFQLAGAQTVLASLWKVPDAETEQLMTDTLSRWLKGMPPHEALREAQLAMIRRLRAEGPRDATRGQAPPVYWAAFICHGR